MVFQEFRAFVYAEAAHCIDCSRVEMPSSASSPTDIPPLTFDVSQTLDGAIVASSAFRVACDRVDGIRFEPIEGLDDLSLIHI